MNKIISIMLIVSACFALQPKPIENMSCIELLDAISALEKLRAAEANGNHETAEKITLALLARTVYFGNRRDNGKYINVEQEMAKLKALLPNCKPY
ncbi:MAG: hypothetical protein RQ763_05095 [Sulfurimonas sp.]|uniref:hypothetical protein n=1 Tax=Sulfurimonas sp. TaxID=2022749 RepID=UPI0028CE7D64|nr:hypothetical protein [Sulfurimonas sp.]MDT8338555.1 hypothetical protein [Sulfurimonas sp.]